VAHSIDRPSRVGDDEGVPAETAPTPGSEHRADTATILFTDIEGSTLLWERESERMRAALAHHDRVLREAIESAGGTVVRMLGDGVHAVFARPSDAVRAAFAIQRRIADDASAGPPLRIRCGIHTGEVDRRDGDLFGPAVNRAARIMGIAPGGHTLVSASVADAVRAELPDGASLERHGHYRLKGVDEPVELFELRDARRASAALRDDADKAYRVVRSGDLWLPAREIRHNLPADRDAFIGRSAALARLSARLADGARLVTVLGAAGIGKTRFARRHAWTSLAEWPGGVYFCDLSEATGVPGIVGAVAAALGVPIAGDEPVAQLGHAIAGRERCLVVLDNFEQVVEHAQSTVARWLERAPQAAFVVTSRARLHVTGEQLFDLEPL
jgi:class 3 adenylate cyclase